jgi:hypothetical protein
MADNVKQIYVTYYITWNVTNLYVKIWQWIERKNEIDWVFYKGSKRLWPKIL